MSSYQLIKTIKISTKVKVSFEDELLKVILNIINKNWRIDYKMAVKFFSRQSPETFTFTILQSQSLELIAIMVVPNVVIDGFSGEDLK